MSARGSQRRAVLAIAAVWLAVGTGVSSAALPDEPPAVAIRPSASAQGAASPLPATMTPSAPPLPTATPAAPPACADPPDGIAAVPVVSHGSRTAKVVALTFDDGWDAVSTAKILAILEASHVNATFFPVGRAIEREPAVWRAVAAAGFPIGDHTYAHRHLKSLCYDVQLAEIERQADASRRVVGERPMLLLRPPYGEYDRTTRIAAGAAGDADVVLWDVDTRDWTGASTRAIVARATRGTNGSIVLMHTFVANTVLALPSIIDTYKARGYQFVTVGQLLGVRGPVPFPQSP